MNRLQERLERLSEEELRPDAAAGAVPFTAADNDELPDDETAGDEDDDEASGLYEHFAITADKGQSLLRLD